MQKYKWFVEYDDNTTIKEDEKIFDELSKENIKKFGLTGNQLDMYYTEDGTFHIGSMNISFKIDDDVEFNSLQPITFKQAHCDFGYKRRINRIYFNRKGSNIDKYYFGYKCNTNKDIKFQPIFVIDEENCDLYFEIRVSGTYNGTLTMYINDNAKIKQDIELKGNAAIFTAKLN